MRLPFDLLMWDIYLVPLPLKYLQKRVKRNERLSFSGDLGNTHKPILRDPIYTKAADYVVMESTYGDRLHGEEAPDYVGESGGNY